MATLVQPIREQSLRVAMRRLPLRGGGPANQEVPVQASGVDRLRWTLHLQVPGGKVLKYGSPHSTNLPGAVQLLAL